METPSHNVGIILRSCLYFLSLVHDVAVSLHSGRKEVLEILQIFSGDLEDRPVVKARVIVQSER